jgi:hypothetical protein
MRLCKSRLRLKPLYHHGSNQSIRDTERKPYASSAARIVIAPGLTNFQATVTSTESYSQARVGVWKDDG